MRETVRRRIISGASLLLFLALLVTLTVLFFDEITAFAKDPAALRARMDETGWRGRALFILLTAAQVVLAVIPGHPFEAAGGFCFGVWLGTLFVSAGILLGSAAAFWLGRLFGVRAITAFYPPEKLEKVRFLQAGEKQTALTFTAFLIPGVPKDMLAYFMGLTNMRFGTFLWVSTLARLPGILLAALGGAALGTRSAGLVIAFAVLLAVVCGGAWFARRHIRKKAANGAENPASGDKNNGG